MLETVVSFDSQQSYTVSQKKTWCRTYCDNFIYCNIFKLMFHTVVQQRL